MVRYYKFKNGSGVNVISNASNVVAAKNLMLKTYGKSDSDISYWESEHKNEPYFDGSNAH